MRSSVNRTEHETGVGADTSRWFGEPVCVAEGPPEVLMKRVPRFDRRPFAMSSVGIRSFESALTPHAMGENDHYDLIVRFPLNPQEAEMPVGIVSKNYTLVQHLDVIERAFEAIKLAGIELDGVSSELTLSTSGSKMAFTFTLPEQF